LLNTIGLCGDNTLDIFVFNSTKKTLILLPRDASAERGDEIACRLSVCLNV